MAKLKWHSLEQVVRASSKSPVFKQAYDEELAKLKSAKEKKDMEDERIGEKANAWKGMGASYYAKHLWIGRHYGKASGCEKCNRPSKRFEWANISGEYRREREDYIQLCASCHRKHDWGDRCRQGHYFSSENTYLRSNGWRVCKKCRRTYALKQYYKNKDNENKK